VVMHLIAKCAQHEDVLHLRRRQAGGAVSCWPSTRPPSRQLCHQHTVQRQQEPMLLKTPADDGHQLLGPMHWDALPACWPPRARAADVGETADACAAGRTCT
jgi:hypothetical protein